MIYLRRIRVSLDDQLVAGDPAPGNEPLAIRMSIRKDLQGLPPEGEVALYNLSPSSEALFHDEGRDIRVEAGYGNNVGVVHDGDVRRVWREREGLNRVTRVAFGGISFKKRAAFVFAQFGVVKVREIVREAVGAIEGARIGPLDAIDAEWEEEDYSFAGDPIRCIAGLLASRPTSFYEEDREIRFTREEEAGNTVVRVSETTGLIGTPVRTDRGVDVVTALNWQARLNARVRLELSQPGALAQEVADTDWKIVSLRHVGGNRDGVFQTEMECWPT